MVDMVKFPSNAPSGQESEGGARFAEFENLLFHNWSTALANPTLWFVTFDAIPFGLKGSMTGDSTADSNTLNKEGPNLYKQWDNNQLNLTKVLENKTTGCMVIHGVTLPEMSVEAGRDDAKMGGYYGGLKVDAIKEQNQLQMEFRETQSSIAEFIIRPWIESVAKYGFIAREPSDPRNVKCRVTVTKLGVAGPGVDPIKRKVWQFYNCAPTSVANHRLAHDGTWSATDMFIQTSWVYSHYKVEDVDVNNISATYAEHIKQAIIRPLPGSRTSGRIGQNSAPAGDITVV